MKIHNLNRNELNAVILNVGVAQNVSQKIESDNIFLQNEGGEKEGFIYHIAINDSEIIGYCFSSGPLKNGTRHIRNIYVAKLFRRNGVAKNLLIEILNNAILQSHKRIKAEVSALTDEHKSLHRLFKRFKKHYENQIEIAWVYSNEEFGKYKNYDFQL